MRFFENGPAIPDDLLIARDEDRVVFFCGAGVSRAYAGLPDFFGLAENVIQTLGVPADNPASKILNEAREIDKRTGISGLISADRIFGLLEREFLSRDIESAVANALKPKEDVDLSAHRILLELATSREGMVRLVTTNFDRLFDSCDADLKVLQAPRLPDPSCHDEMDGVIYLHGCTNKEYSKSEGDGFVLSSSEFGRAYLSDGWATTFFREVIERYIVVFVGYSADDPPVQYLLEALNKRETKLNGVYAFQSGVSSEATARWRHKGVDAISYTDEDGGHSSLWKTLEAWSIRSQEPEKWYQSVIKLARKGPENLQPHERGQVAHIISTLEGARKFSEGDTLPSAEWLCVFDPLRRYAKPGYIGRYESQRQFVDPFEIYGLDSDIAPNKVDPDDSYSKREIPANVWDAFAANRLDHQNLRDDSFSAIRGYWSTNIPTLPSRLNQIGVWISKVSEQATSVWWAAKQTSLHPSIQQQIKWELQYSDKDIPSVIRQAWWYLFETWERKDDDFRNDWYDLKSVIDKDGWDSATIRMYVSMNQPFLTAEKNYWSGPKLIEEKKDLQINDLLSLDVKYPSPPIEIKIPDNFVSLLVQEFHKILEHSLLLETELGGYELSNISPIIPDDSEDVNDYGRTHGLSKKVLYFTCLFERLIKINISLAHHELLTWIENEDTIFCRLKIWASGNAELVNEQLFHEIITNLSVNDFWDTYHQRDLLLVLAKRWEGLGRDTRNKIEERLIEGPKKWENEEEDKFEDRKAWASLKRITWLAEKGCNFTFDIENELKRLRSIVLDWKPEYAAKAADSMEVRGGFVRTDTEHSLLLKEPISSILQKAQELSGRDEFLTEKDPFAGLCNEQPVRAFSSLTYSARNGEYPTWAWRTFLNSGERKKDKNKFSALIAERISCYSDNNILSIIEPISEWTLTVSEQLSSYFPITFKRLKEKLIGALRLESKFISTEVTQIKKEPDWAMISINSPVGKITQAVFKELKDEKLKEGNGFPVEWISYLEDLLALDGDLSRHAIVILSHNLNWFYATDLQWTEKHLLSILDGNNVDNKNAFWSGFFWGAKVPSQNLFVRMKSDLLLIAKERSLTKRGYCTVLTGILLAGWKSIDTTTKNRFISNNEMRDVLLHSDDEFRSNILWQLQRWSENDENDENDENIKWSEVLPEFLKDVWPRQTSIKTPTISARLCDLAFSNHTNFPKLSEIILPLLTKVEHDHLMLPSLRKSRDNIVDVYPKQTLALLHVVLPENVTAWPYDIEKTLQRISESDKILNLDERLIELRRKWNAR